MVRKDQQLAGFIGKGAFSSFRDIGNATDNFAGMPRPPPCCAYKFFLTLPPSSCCSRDDMVIFARWAFSKHARHDRPDLLYASVYLFPGPSAKPNSSALVVVFLAIRGCVEGMAMIGSMFADCQLGQQCPEGMAIFLPNVYGKVKVKMWLNTWTHCINDRRPFGDDHWHVYICDMWCIVEDATQGCPTQTSYQLSE